MIVNLIKILLPNFHLLLPTMAEIMSDFRSILQIRRGRGDFVCHVINFQACDVTGAESVMASSSVHEEISSSDDDFTPDFDSNGVQPYRFEPRRKVDTTEDEEEREESSDGAQNAFNTDIDFGSRVTQVVSEWCICDRCEYMNKPLMNFCCHELDELHDRLFKDDLDCIILHEDFETIVLHESVLRTALVAMKDVRKDSLVEPIGLR